MLAGTVTPWGVSPVCTMNLSVGNLLFFVACHFFGSNYHSTTCRWVLGLWYPFSHLPKGPVSLVLWSKTAQGLGYAWLWGLLLLSGGYEQQGQTLVGIPHSSWKMYWQSAVRAIRWAKKCFVLLGEKAVFLGHVGSWSLTLLCLELISNCWRVFADGRYCISISAWGDVVAAGVGKSLGSIPMSMQAALLKYSLWVFFAYIEGLLGCLTLDIEFQGKPALTHECKASYSLNVFPRWDEVVCRQSHIPEMLKSSEAYGSSTVGEDRHLSAVIPGDVPSFHGIWIWREWDDVSLYLHYLACILSRVWLKVIWVMSVSMATSLASGPFLTTCATFFAWHTLDRWLGFPAITTGLSPYWAF